MPCHATPCESDINITPTRNLYPNPPGKKIIPTPAFVSGYSPCTVNPTTQSLIKRRPQTPPPPHPFHKNKIDGQQNQTRRREMQCHRVCACITQSSNAKKQQKQRAKPGPLERQSHGVAVLVVVLVARPQSAEHQHAVVVCADERFDRPWSAGRRGGWGRGRVRRAPVLL